ncbi:hypothetical protein QAD02_016066 [Eretmocerus hayati]|uniref:Uncharacterized protein n=1 Tax=Eretmocerus hayati TaxID=131215 RepID=A0ACC2PAF7_9HYME|nr:hypothetical protein QAD02_016066 [Eretmocerus hayati]
MLISRPCSCLIVVGIVLSVHPALPILAHGHQLNSTTTATTTTSVAKRINVVSDAATQVVKTSNHPITTSSINSTIERHQRSSRRKRFARFPLLPPSYVLEGAPPPPHPRNVGYSNLRFGGGGGSGPGPWSRQPKAYNWRQHSGGPPSLDYGPLRSSPPQHQQQPVMAHRTPRLIFRDDFSLVSGSANNFFQTNQIPDIDDDFRDHRKQIFNEYPRLETEARNKEKRPVWKGDDSLCADGRSCEFFLMCWMSAGLLDGSCGGIMYACCHRTKDAAKASNDYNLVDDQIQSLATDSYISEAAAAAAAVADEDEQCGISASKQTAQRRIVGGDEAGFGSFPWQAYIRIGSSRCGGTLVNRFHVVTAGHCVAKASARQVQVTLGDYVVNSATESLPAYTFGVREIRVHPYFKFTPQADRFDVAVLRLDRPVHYMPHIAPICLPEKNEDFLGKFGWAAGWGALQAGSRLRPKTLQAVDVPVIDNRICERWHRSNGINVIIYDEMMCAGYPEGGKDSCQGDSGGPLMLERTGKWYLIGIVSAGYSCAQPRQPGIYHRVAKTVDWITYVINS